MTIIVSPPRKEICSEVEKVWQPGNLVARKFVKNWTLGESFWILLPHFLAVKQFDGKFQTKQPDYFKFLTKIIMLSFPCLL